MGCAFIICSSINRKRRTVPVAVDSEAEPAALTFKRSVIPIRHAKNNHI